MEIDEIKTVWLEINKKLEGGLKLNEKHIGLVQTQKMASNLRPIYWHRLIELILHLVAIGLLLVFLAQNISEPPYALSAIALLVLYGGLAMAAARQIKLLTTLDYCRDLASMQSILVRLQTHIVNYSRLSVLFIPTFLAYPVIATKVIKDYDLSIWGGFDIIRQSNGAWWEVQLIATLVLVPLGIWFYKKISFRNMDKKWVRDYITKMTGQRIAKALEFMKELQELKN